MSITPPHQPDHRRPAHLFALAAALPLTLLGGCGAAETTPAQPAAAAAAPSMAFSTVRVYKGSAGMQIVIAKVQDQDAKWIIRISGSETVMDNLILPYEQTTGGRNVLYKTMYDGVLKQIVTTDPRKTVADFWGKKAGYNETASSAFDSVALVRAYDQAVADGSLKRVQTFNRPAALAKRLEELAAKQKVLSEHCGGTLQVKIDLDGLTDEILGHRSFYAGLLQVVAIAAQQCKQSQAAKAVFSHMETFEIVPHEADEPSVVVEGKTLRWRAKPQRSKWDLIVKLLGEKVMAGEQQLWRAMRNEDTLMCTDGNGQFLGVLGKVRGRAGVGVFFGTEGKLLTVRPRPELGYRKGPSFSREHFFDPRFPIIHNENRPNPRATIISSIIKDKDSDGCILRCGSNDTKLVAVGGEEKDRLLASDTFTETFALDWEPHALARDRNGIYYYVDRSLAPESREYRVMKGQKGKLINLKMKNVITDSQGDIFVTRRGTLKLVLEKDQTLWVKGSRKKKLINLPVTENLHLIYNDLGIYNTPYGTPCDVF